MNAAKGAGSVMPLALERHGQGSDAWCELWHCSSFPPGAFVTCTTPQHSGLDVCLGSLSLAQILTGQTSVSSLSNHTDAVVESKKGWGGFWRRGREREDWKRPTMSIIPEESYQLAFTFLLNGSCSAGARSPRNNLPSLLMGVQF